MPENMAGTRQEWLKDDIANIDKIISLLSAEDETKVNAGLNEVSNILPFLMVGGFSKTEIVSYLQAKKEAAQQTLQELSQEEEEKVSVSTQKATTQRTMSATMEQSESSTTMNTDNASSASEEEDSPLSAGSLSSAATATSQATFLFVLADLKKPTLLDIVRYETRGMIQDKAKVEDIEKMHAALEKIANPASIADAVQREKLEQLKQKLADEKQKGSMEAGNILSAVNTVGKKEGLPSGISLAQSNVAEPVKDDEYEELRKIWEENYKTSSVPSPFTQDVKGRIEWIGQDQKIIEETISLLHSPEPAKKQEGEKRISEILPFLLLGGFSVDETMKYLQVKVDAAKNVLESLRSEEDKQIPAGMPQANEQEKKMAINEEQQKG